MALRNRKNQFVDKWRFDFDIMVEVVLTACHGRVVHDATEV
jgi:hypothetical protein